MCFRLEGPSCVVQGRTLPRATTAGEVRLSPHSRRRKGDAEAPHSGEEGKVLGLKPRGLVSRWHPGLSDPQTQRGRCPTPKAGPQNTAVMEPVLAQGPGGAHAGGF